MSEKIITGKCIHLAVKRHLRDLEDGAARGLVFREDKAERAIRFFQFLKHSKGEWAGSVISLEPWRRFIFWVLFAWYRTEGTRLFRPLSPRYKRADEGLLQVFTLVSSSAGSYFQ